VKIILRAVRSIELYGDQCDFALVDLEKGLLAAIHARRKAFVAAKRRDSDLVEMYYFDASAQFFRCYGALEMQGYDFEEIGTVPSDFEVPDEHFQRTELNQMVVMEDNVYFLAHPMHCDYHVTTHYLSERYISELAVRPKHHS